MNGNVVPAGAMALEPQWINFFDNAGLVQFIHRMLAGIIFIMTCIFVYRTSKINLNIFQKRGVKFFVSVIILQIILGICTLLTTVNIYLAIFHQVGAFLLFSVCVYLLFLFHERSLKI